MPTCMPAGDITHQRPAVHAIPASELTQQHVCNLRFGLGRSPCIGRSRNTCTYVLLPAGFTRSHFQRDLSLNSKPPEITIPQHTSKAISPSHNASADMFAEVNSNPRWQYKNSLNNTHYMLYHADAPPQHPVEPFTFGFLTTMARTEGKMRHKKPVTVTIIGGSVTTAYCKEPGIGCWVTPVTDWLLRENPQVQPTHPYMFHTMVARIANPISLCATFGAYQGLWSFPRLQWPVLVQQSSTWVYQESLFRSICIQPES